MNGLIQFTSNHFDSGFSLKLCFSGKLNCASARFTLFVWTFFSFLFIFPLKLSNNYFVFVLTIWWIKCGKLFEVNFFVNVQSVDKNVYVNVCVCVFSLPPLIGCVHKRVSQTKNSHELWKLLNHSMRELESNEKCLFVCQIRSVPISSVSNSIYSVITNIQHYWVNLLINYFLGFLVV